MPRESRKGEALHNIRLTARKELAGFFASPAAFLFLGAFLAVTLFVFFWVETFFSRGLADVRPLFQWMPLLLIVLVAALTMRAWAEERRAGTLELLLTSPTAPTELVLGKFLGAMGLVAIALALTLPLPITVSLLGPLDWGPVIGGYVAALALASAYVAIGLWVSSRTDNQIVSLILTVLIAGAFYLIGASVLTNLFGHRVGEVLRELGAGARFDSITRGVLDLRDLYYYLSLTATFLVLNRLAIERLRWAGNPPQPSHRRWTLIAALLAANALAANFWLQQVRGARVDLTAGQIYTLSDTTRTYLAQLQEPLLIRGYFSAATHPLLSPLVPQLRDLLQEYAVAGGNKVRVEFVDPHDDPKMEEEAASKYGVRPVPFQTAGKYQASVVNSYFDIVVNYGDQFQRLGFRDLIDVKVRAEGEFDVALKNPEYDITRAVRKVLLSYQGGGNPFSTLPRPVEFTGYVSQGLPSNLAPTRKALDDALAQLRAQAGDKLRVTFKDPSTDAALAKQLTDEGLQPYVTGLLDPRPFWFQMTLADGRQVERVPLPETADVDGFKRSIEAAVKRFAPGFLKTVAVVTPTPSPEMGRGSANFGSLREALEDSARWLDTDLSDGHVPAAADMLLVLAPESLNTKQVFAIDQFLMQGGTVLISTSPTDVSLGQGIVPRPVQSGLQDWLAGIGINLGKNLVLDTQSGALPIPIERPIGGGMSVREVRLAPYPYFVDVRGTDLDSANPVTASLGEINVPWAVPVNVDTEKNQARKVTTLLRSSRNAWLSDSANLLPDYRQYPQIGFPVGSQRGSQPLAVMVEGPFDSAYKGKPSPLLEAEKDKPTPDKAAEKPDSKGDAKPSPFANVGRVINQSPASARLIVIGSNALFNDQTMNLVSQARGTTYRKPDEFALNLVDWSLEDQGLLAIRSRTRYARTLDPLTPAAQAGWEYGDYALVLAGLVIVWVVLRRRRKAAAQRYELLLQEV
jgi:ABC-2 type transport system permease protein